MHTADSVRKWECPLLYLCRESLQENPLSWPLLLLSCGNGLAAASGGHREVSATTRVSEVLKYEVGSHRRPPRKEGAPALIFGSLTKTAFLSSRIGRLSKSNFGHFTANSHHLQIKLRGCAWLGAGRRARGWTEGEERGPRAREGAEGFHGSAPGGHTLHWLWVVSPGLGRLQHSALRTFLSWEIS